MNKELNVNDLGFILESLKYSKLKFEEYQGYPNEEFRQKRISEANDVIEKVKLLKKTFKEF